MFPAATRAKLSCMFHSQVFRPLWCSLFVSQLVLLAATVEEKKREADIVTLAGYVKWSRCGGVGNVICTAYKQGKLGALGWYKLSMLRVNSDQSITYIAEVNSTNTSLSRVFHLNLSLVEPERFKPEDSERYSVNISAANEKSKTLRITVTVKPVRCRDRAYFTCRLLFTTDSGRFYEQEDTFHFTARDKLVSPKISHSSPPDVYNVSMRAGSFAGATCEAHLNPALNTVSYIEWWIYRKGIHGETISNKVDSDSPDIIYAKNESQPANFTGCPFPTVSILNVRLTPEDNGISFACVLKSNFTDRPLCDVSIFTVKTPKIEVLSTLQKERIVFQHQSLGEEGEEGKYALSCSAVTNPITTLTFYVYSGNTMIKLNGSASLVQANVSVPRREERVLMCVATQEEGGEQHSFTITKKFGDASEKRKEKLRWVLKVAQVAMTVLSIVITGLVGYVFIKENPSAFDDAKRDSSDKGKSKQRDSMVSASDASNVFSAKRRITLYKPG